MRSPCTEAEQTLHKLGPAAASILINTVGKSQNVTLRLRLIAILERMGPDARSVLRDLMNIAASDPLPTVRRAAAKAAEAIQKTQ
jgi:hypothetical protein